MTTRDWFRGSTAGGSDDLLRALIDGLDRKDYPALMQLINGRSVEIREHFAAWLKVPDSLRTDREGLERYSRTLFMIAEVFAKAGDESLRESIFGGGGRTNFLLAWKDDLSRAQGLLESRRFDDAVAILRSVLHAMEGACGSGVDYYRARALGSLGVALAETGHTAEAIAVSREALQVCKDTADEGGVTTYTANLQRLESTIALPGERPCTVVFLDEQRRPLREDELGNVTGTIRWEIRTREPDHPEARRLHVEGRSAGARGDYGSAIELLTKAADLDPSWPYPVYDRAFTRLLQHDFDGALADYQATLKLAPSGFFLAARAVNVMTREAAGEFPRGLYAAFASLEELPAETQRNILRELVQKFPTCAPAWERHADWIDDPTERLQAIEQGLASAPDPDTRGGLLVRMALAEDARGNRDRALEILVPLTRQADSLSACALARVALAKIRTQRVE